MSVTVTISNYERLQKVKDLLGAKDENETVEFALERIVEEFEQRTKNNDLPSDFFEDLYNEESAMRSGASIQAVLQEREESNF